jgi:glycosyltransferase involved in cell wall biosynthesis
MYRREQRSEKVVVHRAPLYPSHDKNGVRRIANYASFALSAAWVARRHLPKPDVWLTYSSPATAALPALLAPRRLQAPSYLIIQDLWPDSVTESGFVNGSIGRGVERTLNEFCNWAYRRSTGIGVISPGMSRVLVERGVDTHKISYTPNWIEDEHLLPDLPASDDLRASLGLPAGMLFMYAGNMGELQGLNAVVEAFEFCPDVNLALVGDGVVAGRIRTLVDHKGLRNVHFVPSQSAATIGRFIAASDVQIVSLKDSALLRATMPSKVQTSMAASRPILAHVAGDVAQLVTDCGAGLAARPGDVQSVVSAVRHFCALGPEPLRNMGRNARREYERSFSPSAGLDRLEMMLQASARAVSHV